MNIRTALAHYDVGNFEQMPKNNHFSTALGEAFGTAVGALLAGLLPLLPALVFLLWSSMTLDPESDPPWNWMSQYYYFTVRWPLTQFGEVLWSACVAVWDFSLTRFPNLNLVINLYLLLLLLCVAFLVFAIALVIWAMGPTGALGFTVWYLSAAILRDFEAEGPQAAGVAVGMLVFFLQHVVPLIGLPLAGLIMWLFAT